MAPNRRQDGGGCDGGSYRIPAREKAEAVVGPWLQIRDVAYDNDMMPKNRDGAYEDYGLTRTYEEEFRAA